MVAQVDSPSRGRTRRADEALQIKTTCCHAGETSKTADEQICELPLVSVLSEPIGCINSEIML